MQQKIVITLLYLYFFLFKYNITFIIAPQNVVLLYFSN